MGIQEGEKSMTPAHTELSLQLRWSMPVATSLTQLLKFKIIKNK